MIREIAVAHALICEIERLLDESGARSETLTALVREVSDLRCTLREIRDLTTEDAIREMAASKLLQ